MPVFRRNPQVRRYEHWIAIAALIASLHLADDLLLHANHLGGRVLWRGAAIRLFNCAELASHHPLLKLMPHLAVGRLPHAAIHRRL